MADRNDSFEQGKAALRGIKDSLSEGVTRVRMHVADAAKETAETAEDVGEALLRHGSRAAQAAKAGAAAARDDVTDAAADARAEVADGLDKARDGISDGVRAARDDVQEALEAAREAWVQAKAATQQAARDALTTSRDAVSNAETQVSDYVRSKPLKALAIAGAAGFVLAMLLKRSR